MEGTSDSIVRKILRRMVLYDGPDCQRMATEAFEGRYCIRIEEETDRSVLVRLLEDGYVCYMSSSDWMEGTSISDSTWIPPRLDEEEIQDRMPMILEEAMRMKAQENKYLWGGTIGPDVDCSGLVQTCYGRAGIWLPRDAYQQAELAERVALDRAIPGDLLFFGGDGRIDHVAIFLGWKEGIAEYIHSSGREHGNDGIDVNRLTVSGSKVCLHYRRRYMFCSRVRRGVLSEDRFAVRPGSIPSAPRVGSDLPPHELSDSILYGHDAS